MSERGSFVTEYLYCDECGAKVLDAIRDVYQSLELRGEVVGINNNRIVAGSLIVPAGYLGQERDIAELYFVPAIETIVRSHNHNLRFVVLPDAGGCFEFEVRD